MTGFEHLKSTISARATQHGMVWLETRWKSAAHEYENGTHTEELRPDQAIAIGQDLIAAGEAALAKTSI